MKSNERTRHGKEGLLLEVLVANLRKRIGDERGAQIRLAERAKLDQGYISRVLRLKSDVTLSALSAFARGCDCDAWELLVDDDAIREKAIRHALNPKGEELGRK